MPAMQEVVHGVWLGRSGEYLEEVRLPFVTMQLLAAWDGTELIRQMIPKGRHFGLRPEEGWTALESFYLLQGNALWEEGGRRIELGPGDCLTGRPVQEPCILTAQTDLTILYVCSQPAFHQLSGEVDRLRELAVSVEVKDGYTADHCSRIQELAVRIGRQIQLSPVRMHYLLYGAFLHDLGKVNVPDAILNKPGRLTADEWAVMKQHPVFGRDLLAGTSIAGAAFILEQHHERLDGTGYPHGLAGDAISLEAQIVAVADSYDAMTTDRVYRPGMSHDQAMAELEKGRGTSYRPDVLDALHQVVDTWIEATHAEQEVKV